MSENNQLQRRSTEIIKEKSQYVIAFGVIAAMLYITGFPIFLIFFFGILAYFIWKTLASPTPAGTREIFEFLLVANDILRDDDRRWYGFEIKEAIGRGESIRRHMSAVPPIVHFALGALYNRIGDHQAAVQSLAQVLEDENSDETRMVFPTPELRNFVRTLRKIEREPAEAPLMSAAVRALERARRNRGKALLEESRAALDAEKIVPAEAELDTAGARELTGEPGSFIGAQPTLREEFDEHYRQATAADEPKPKRRRREKTAEEGFRNRQSISEVLRDIYDSK